MQILLTGPKIGINQIKQVKFRGPFANKKLVENLLAKPLDVFILNFFD